MLTGHCNLEKISLLHEHTRGKSIKFTKIRHKQDILDKISIGATLGIQQRVKISQKIGAFRCVCNQWNIMQFKRKAMAKKKLSMCTIKFVANNVTRRIKI